MDNDIGSAAKLSSPRLSTVANHSKGNGSNIKTTRDLNAQNNVSTDGVINAYHKHSYSSHSPKVDKQASDYTGSVIYDDSSDELHDSELYDVRTKKNIYQI